MTRTTVPLTAFEEYMLTEDCTEHPMTFSLVVTFQVPPDRRRLAMALDQVVRRHRLLCARLKHGGRPSWCCTDVVPPRLDPAHSDALHGSAGGPHIDLRRQAGLRATLRSVGHESRLTLHFHHCCCDGMAAVEFLQQLLHGYARHTGRRSNGDATLGTHSWPSRHVRLTGLTLGRRVRHFAKDLARMLAFFCRRPLTLAPSRRVGRSHVPDQHEPVLSADIRLPEKRETLKRRHGSHATINDVILRDVFLAVAEWTRQGDASHGKDWIRVAVATNMRDRGTIASQCLNDVSMVFLDRRRRGIQDSQRLLQGISQEMSQIKRDRMGRAMLRALKWLQTVPRGLSVVKWVNAPATVTVSNLGEILLDPGARGLTQEQLRRQALVKHISVVVPVRRGVPVGIGVSTYEGRLTISMQYDRAVCDRRSACGLFSLLYNRVKRSLGNASCDDRLTTTRSPHVTSRTKAARALRAT